MAMFVTNDPLEADEVGTVHVAQAGYDPRAVATLLRRLYPFEGSNDSKLATLFATHPPAAARIARIEAVIVREGLATN